MANHPSALRRHRQSLKRNARNRAVKAEIFTMIKTIGEAGKEDAKKLFRVLQSKIDKAGRRHLFHPKTAAKKVAKLYDSVFR